MLTFSDCGFASDLLEQAPAAAPAVSEVMRRMATAGCLEGKVDEPSTLLSRFPVLTAEVELVSCLKDESKEERRENHASKPNGLNLEKRDSRARQNLRERRVDLLEFGIIIRIVVVIVI
jgi:hypothetical protein